MSIRVLLADDSALARSILRTLLETDPEMEVVGEACNGQEAVDLARLLKPQVITMDLKMPVLDGVAAVTEIMASNPVPILVVSSIADAGEACEAIAHGALDAVGKPELDEAGSRDFVARVKMISRIRVITHLRNPGALVRPESPPVQPAENRPGKVFALAASTGGPQALAVLLGALPADFPCPVLIAQHIADGFAPGMATWLSGVSALPVLLAREGEEVRAGTVYLSPSEQNLMVTKNFRLHLAAQAAEEVYHPSCDVLLSSVAEVYGAQAVGIIMTGMGRDGCIGLKRIQATGGHTLAQDEASSVIFGMNKVAIDARAADRVLALQDLPAAMTRLSRAPQTAGRA